MRQCVRFIDGQIQKVTAAHDAGKVINPTLFEGQIEGSIHMGLGYATSEELVLENGRPKSTRLRKCGILRAKEMPDIEATRQLIKEVEDLINDLNNVNDKLSDKKLKLKKNFGEN